MEHEVEPPPDPLEPGGGKNGLKLFRYPVVCGANYYVESAAFTAWLPPKQAVATLHNYATPFHSAVERKRPFFLKCPAEKCSGPTASPGSCFSAWVVDAPRWIRVRP